MTNSEKTSMARVAEIHRKDKMIDFLRVLIVLQTLHPKTFNVHGVDSHSQGRDVALMWIFRCSY